MTCRRARPSRSSTQTAACTRRRCPSRESSGPAIVSSSTAATGTLSTCSSHPAGAETMSAGCCVSRSAARPKHENARSPPPSGASGLRPKGYGRSRSATRSGRVRAWAHEHLRRHGRELRDGRRASTRRLRPVERLAAQPVATAPGRKVVERLPRGLWPRNHSNARVARTPCSVSPDSMQVVLLATEFRRGRSWAGPEIASYRTIVIWSRLRRVEPRIRLLDSRGRRRSSATQALFARKSFCR